MPRYRTIKPEFWSNGQVVECSPNARLLFLGLLNFCDDAGRHVWRPKQIKAEIFPADDFTPDDIGGMIEELASNRLIAVYVNDGQEFIQVTGWHHQRIDKPQKPKCPDPLDDQSEVILGSLAEYSKNVRRTFPPEGSREEKSRREGKGRDVDRAAEAASPPKTKPAASTGSGKNQVPRPDFIDEQVWSDFLAHRRQKKAKLTPTAWTRIEQEVRAGIEAGHDANDMLAEAMAAGWQGFKLEWYENRIRKAPAGGGNESPAERAAREAVEYRRRQEAEGRCFSNG